MTARVLILIAALMVTACKKSDGSDTASALPAPSNPAFVPTYQWPPTGALQSSTFGGLSCALTSDRNVSCFDGTDAPVSASNTYAHEMNDVVVGNGIACSIADAYGPPVACTTNLTSDQDCNGTNHPPNTPTYGQPLCWSYGITAPTWVNVADQSGYGDTNLYNHGPTAITVNSNGVICVTESIYDMNSVPYGNWIVDVTKCGTRLDSQHHLQPQGRAT